MQRCGDLGRVCQRREVVAHLFCYGPAEFPRPECLVLVCLAQQHVGAGRIGPLRRGRVYFLKHGQRQPGAAGREAPPRSWIRDQPGQRLIAPPLRPGRQPVLVISHPPDLGGQLGWHGFHPDLPRDRQASVDEEVTPDLTAEGARRGQQRPRPAMPDEDRGLARCGAGDHLGLRQAVRRPGREGLRQVWDAHLPPAPG